MAALALALLAPAAASANRQAWDLDSANGTVTTHSVLLHPASCADGGDSSVHEVIEGTYSVKTAAKVHRKGPVVQYAPFFGGPIGIGGPLQFRWTYRKSATETYRDVERVASETPGEPATCTQVDHTCTKVGPVHHTHGFMVVQYERAHHAVATHWAAFMTQPSEGCAKSAYGGTLLLDRVSHTPTSYTPLSAFHHRVQKLQLSEKRHEVGTPVSFNTEGKVDETTEYRAVAKMHQIVLGYTCKENPKPSGWVCDMR